MGRCRCPERHPGNSWLPILFLMVLIQAFAPPAMAELQQRQLPLRDMAIEANTGPVPASPRNRRIHTLIPDASDACLSTLATKASTSQQMALNQALHTIRQSELGEWLLRLAERQNVMVCVDKSTDLEAHYRSHLRLIGVSAKLDPAGQVVFLSHELAHVPQHPRFSNSRHFSPQDMLLLQRVREATAEAIATRVLWQLRQKGIHAPWQKKLTTAYGDIASRFAIVMAGDDDPTRELWATRTAFLHWFDADWRLGIYDDLMLTTLIKIAADRTGLLPPSRQLSDDYLRDIAWYAGETFLMRGDGQALIEGFGLGAASSERRARLDAILATAPVPATEEDSITSMTGDALSASSSGPIVTGSDDLRTMSR